MADHLACQVGSDPSAERTQSWRYNSPHLHPFQRLSCLRHHILPQRRSSRCLPPNVQSWQLPFLLRRRASGLCGQHRHRLTVLPEAARCRRRWAEARGLWDSLGPVGASRCWRRLRVSARPLEQRWSSVWTCLLCQERLRFLVSFVFVTDEMMALGNFLRTSSVPGTPNPLLWRNVSKLHVLYGEVVDNTGRARPLASPRCSSQDATRY